MISTIASLRTPAWPADRLNHSGLLAAAVARLRRWQRVAATRRELAALGSAALQDLGLSLAEVGSVAAEVHGAVEPQRVRSLMASGKRVRP